MRYIVLAFLCAALTSCNYFKETILSKADYFVAGRIEKRFNLNSKQDAWVRKKLSAHWQRIRTQHFPKAKQAIAQVVQIWKSRPTGLNLQAVRRIYTIARAHIVSAFAPAIPDAAELLLSLTPKQWQHSLAYMKENPPSWMGFVHKPFSAYREKRKEHLGQRFSRWYGDLQDSQEKRVTQLITLGDQKNFQEYAQQRVAARTFMRDFFLAKPSQERAQKVLASWLEDQSLMRPEALRGRYQRMQTVWQQWWVTLDQLASAQQRRQAIAQLEDWGRIAARVD